MAQNCAWRGAWARSGERARRRLLAAKRISDRCLDEFEQLLQARKAREEGS
jgi:hypothetical protein